MVKGIVFDLDGTLIDSLATTFDAFNRGITMFGGKKHTPQEILKLFGPGELQILAKIVGEENAPKAFQAARQYMDENMNMVPLHQGVGELLEQLKSAGVPISIFTGRGWETTELILKHHRLLDRFTTIITHDHVSLPKPSPEGLYTACEKMRLEPSQVLMVGDSPADLHAARVGGSTGVAALWDILADRKELEKHKPGHWADQPGTVWEIWESYCPDFPVQRTP